MSVLDRLKQQVENLTKTVMQIKENQVPEVSAREATTNGLLVTDNVVEQNTADIEYIAMMTDVDLEEGE